MPILRNPFRKQDENVRPSSDEVVTGYETKIIDVDSKNPVEYQLSGESLCRGTPALRNAERWANVNLPSSLEINDSGVYLPPPPTDRKSFWGTTSSRSTTSSSINRCAYDENEPFNISRESFDSYRRSFVSRKPRQERDMPFTQRILTRSK
jgi:hypothetical protein